MQVSLFPQCEGNLTCTLPFPKHTQTSVIFQVRRVLLPIKQTFHLGPFYQVIVLKYYFLHWSRNMSFYTMKNGKERGEELQHSLGKYLVVSSDGRGHLDPNCSSELATKLTLFCYSPRLKLRQWPLETPEPFYDANEKRCPEHISLSACLLLAT